MITHVRCGSLFTGDATPVRDNATIGIGDEGRITFVCATAEAPPVAVHDSVLDYSTLFVMPGLIDVHTHLTMETNFDPYHELSTSVAKSALIGARNAKVTLQAGITTVRNVGADGFADV